MSQLKRKTSGTSQDSTASKNIPKTFDEFLIAKGLRDWPEPLTSEGPLDMEPNLGFGTFDTVHAQLTEAAVIDDSAFDALTARLEEIEKLLHKYADVILTTPGDTDSDEKVFITETDGEHGKNSKPKAQETIMDIKKRSVDYCEYAGFLKNELNELPSQLEAPQILNKVTKVQDFNSGFKKFWHKVFLSEASVAVMQDLFWYYYIVKFEPSNPDKLKLFDRIADSFVALFFSVNPEIKDKFFQVYAHCLAQAVYLAFYKGFPESTKKFDENFIDHLVSICVEWTCGIKPVPESWRNWDIEKLVSTTTQQKRKAIEAPSAASAFHGGLNLSLDMEGFHRTINHLGQIERRSLHANKLDTRPASKLSHNDTAAKATKYSHPIGPGPQFETVSFDTLGQSPLVAHFLKQRKLKVGMKQELKVKRTQIAKLAPKTQTYQEVIDERVEKSTALNRQYQQAVVENEEEIARIKRKNAKTNREINQISRQVLFNKNPVDIKIISERVLDMMERENEPPQLTERGSSSDDD